MSNATVKLYVGIDAHQETLSIAVLGAVAEAAEPVRVLPNEPGRVRGYFKKLLERGPIQATYEAGCMGFVLYRQLESLGVDCLVAAPSRIPTLPGDHRKTDRLDAERLALFLRGGQLSPVSPPTPETEALRSLVRTRQSIQEDVVRARHRLQKFLLLRGLSWSQGNWSAKHWTWLRELKLALEEDQETMGFLRLELELRINSLKMLDERILRRAQTGDVAAKVTALLAFRGIGVYTALCVVAEIGDPFRFGSPEQVASYCGLIPSEHSSGQKVRRGAITRSGNPRLRRLMVESSQHYARTLGPGYARQTRRANAPAPVVELARKADQRLGERYRQLAHRKHTNQAKTAVARELIAFLWRALLLVPATQ
jgi:transposase